MASEIRANTLKNRVGLGTVSFTNTGPVVSGIVTATSIEVVGAVGDNAGRIKLPDGMTGSPYTGNLELGNSRDFVMVHDAHHTYITNNTGDLYIGNSAGNFPVYIKGNNAVEVRYASALVLQTTSSGVSFPRDIDVDGHTNLDNVSIAGIVTATTFSGNISGGTVAGTTGTFSGNLSITDKIVHTDDTNTSIRFPEVDAVTIETNGSERFRINSSGAWGIGAAYGSSGQVLTSGGSGSSPSWTTIAGGVTSDAQNNTVGGTNAGDSFSGTNANHNTLFGYDAGTGITSGDYNTAIGSEALDNGNLAADTVAVGYRANKSSTTGMRNVAVGSQAMLNTTDGAYNVAVGYQAGRDIASSSHNVAVGYEAGYDTPGGANTFVGSQAGKNLTSGSYNILIGYNAQASTTTTSSEVTIGDTSITKFRIPGLSLEFAKDHTYGVSGGRKNWFDNGSFDCIGGRRANTSMDYGNHHAYGWVTDRFMSRNSVQWSRSTNVPTGKGFSYSTQTNGAGGQIMQAVELPDYGDMGVFTPGSYWCVSIWSTASMNHSGGAFSYDLGSTRTDVTGVGSGTYATTGETAAGTSTGTFNRYYRVYGPMPSSIISGATGLYFQWGFTAAGYATGWQLERVPTSTSKPTPYEHVHPAVTTARCRRYCYQCVNSRLFNGYKRHDSQVSWSDIHPVPPTHMPSGSNQSADPYGIIMHDGGMLTNFQSVLQNPGVNSLSRSEFDYRSGRFIIVGSTSWGSTHTTVPSWESQEYEIQHGFF